MTAAAIFALAWAILYGATEIADAIRELNNEDENEDD